MNYFTIEAESMVNGPGLRVVFWVAGCEHHCKNCHNPETWDKDAGTKVTKDVQAELMDILGKDYHTGITFSGGDPLAPYNRREVTRLVKLIRETFGNKKDIWLYTGYTYDEVKHLSVIKYLDVLVDGPFIEDLKDPKLLWRGSSNQRLIDIPKTLKTNKVVNYIYKGI